MVAALRTGLSNKNSTAFHRIPNQIRTDVTTRERPRPLDDRYYFDFLCTPGGIRTHIPGSVDLCSNPLNYRGILHFFR